MTRSKQAYHHGDLRQALIAEALVQIRERGLEGWSLRELAAAVGVSHTAPYHHFKDRRELLTAVAREGLDLMDQRMAVEQEAAGKHPLKRLLAIGKAYVMFALERPDYYAAISAGPDSAGGKANCEPPPQPGGTWMRLIEAVQSCQRAGHLAPGDPTIVAAGLWALVHGVSELWRLGALRWLPQAAEDPERLTEQILRAAVPSLRVAKNGAGKEQHR